ncbi:M20/M25/M40 family metallo-hydrolase [Streptomyces sp. 3MP-14]|uniref:M20/M25/M40 family metallo-hydrolase n=1 Tax=Streptomyces mimosae TaxID=2586635 RepID=A0A5N5ZWT9_9ACTN|nr:MULTISPECIES: dipeptidase [Streptomyces]KAB8160239.1 M20/M25/M40 family metallo-hydrolase [Streptomyces mimosae]KAB8172999.1 M20/M25/M40 family metallo-hydrolase [Streptomyces sp. 3MP-14]
MPHSPQHAAVAASVAAALPGARDELAELVAFRSVADARQFPVEECRAAARWIVDALRAEGFPDVRVLETPDGTESVYGELPGPQGAPTVLLYAHYDVQPPLDEAAWSSPPFELTERDGRWYGRGAADCKGGVLMHLLALRALRAGGGVPVGVKVIVEGSEEQGTGGLERYAREHPELLAADVIVIGDTGNVRAGQPTVTASLRGMATLEVTVETLAGNLHSGAFGGVAPDALAALVRMLDSLFDADGALAVDGLDVGGSWGGTAYPEEAFRADAGVLDGVGLIGSGSVADRLWARPSLTVMGIDCPPVVGATPSVQARARAALGLRVPPGMAPGAASALVEAHLRARAPWGARVSVERTGEGQPFRADVTSPAYAAMASAMRDAYDGAEMAVVGQGGSIPLTATLGALYPEAEVVMIGLSDAAARIHAVDESVSPEELERMSVAEALFLARYAASLAG